MRLVGTTCASIANILPPLVVRSSPKGGLLHIEEWVWLSDALALYLYT